MSLHCPCGSDPARRGEVIPDPGAVLGEQQRPQHTAGSGSSSHCLAGPGLMVRDLKGSKCGGCIVEPPPSIMRRPLLSNTLHAGLISHLI